MQTLAPAVTVAPHATLVPPTSSPVTDTVGVPVPPPPVANVRLQVAGVPVLVALATVTLTVAVPVPAAVVQACQQLPVVSAPPRRSAVVPFCVRVIVAVPLWSVVKTTHTASPALTVAPQAAFPFLTSSPEIVTVAPLTG